MPLPDVASNQILGWNTGDRTGEEVFEGSIRKRFSLPRQAPTASLPYSMLRANANVHAARGLEPPSGGDLMARFASCFGYEAAEK